MNIKEYIDDIGRRIKGEKVLDVGCLGSYTKSQLQRHASYRQAAKDIIGIDYNKTFLERAIADGEKNLYHCDITNDRDVHKINEKFGLFKHTIATDVIEHLDTPGLFLRFTKQYFMEDDGYLYLTTPNIRSPHWFSMFTKKRPEKINDDHMCWYDEVTLGYLLKRCGLVIDELFYCSDDNDKKSAKKLGLKFEPWMGRRLYVIVRKENG